MRGLLPAPRWALTPPFHPCLRAGQLPDPCAGGLFSVVLSLGFPRPGVTRHRRFMESGLSSKVALRGHPVIRARPDLGTLIAMVNGKAVGQIGHQLAICLVQWPIGRGSEPQAEGVQNGPFRCLGPKPKSLGVG